MVGSHMYYDFDRCREIKTFLADLVSLRESTPGQVNCAKSFSARGEVNNANVREE